MISGFIVDFTLDEQGRFIILELGEINNSKLSGNKALLNPGGNSIREQYRDFLLARSPRTPTKIIIGNAASYIGISSFDINERRLFKSAFPFHLRQDKADIEIVIPFLITMALRDKQKTFRDVLLQPSRLADQDLSKRIAIELLLARISATQSKTASTKFLMLPLALHAACKNKKNLHRYMQDSIIYPKTFCGRLAPLDRIALANFLSNSDHDFFVLKPTNGSCGHGVVVLHKIKILNYLDNIINGYCIDPFWRQEENRKAYFLLQECRPSKKITVGTEQYRPTGRLVFAYDDSDITTTGPLKFLGSYWKLPALPAADEYSTESLVSRISSRSPTSKSPISAVIAEEDLLIILEQFYQHFLPVYEQMLKDTSSALARYKRTIGKEILSRIDYIFTRLGNYEEQTKAIISFINALSCYSLNHTPISLKPEYAHTIALLFAGIPLNAAYLFSDIKLSNAYCLQCITFLLKKAVAYTCEWQTALNTANLENHQILGILQGLSLAQVTNPGFFAKPTITIQPNRITYDEGEPPGATLL